MRTVSKIVFGLSLAIAVGLWMTPADSEAQVRTTLAEIEQYDTKLVEVEAIPLVSTFKEDEGYGVWNLLIGQDEQKLLCYEDGANVEDLRNGHEGVEAIIEKNEDFNKEGRELESITVRGFYDGENEILNLTEIVYLRAGSEYRFDTDAGDEAERVEEEEEPYEYGGTVERYIIFHEVGLPWLYGPAWWHYPAWWGWVWVDLHWGWRPWYDCGLGWYVDYYCWDWRYRRCDRYDYWGRPYRRYDRRRGLHRDPGVRYYDKQYRARRVKPRSAYGDKEYRAPRRGVKADRSRGTQIRQKSYRNIERTRKTYRSGVKYHRPTISRQPTRSHFRSSYSGHQVSRSQGSRPSIGRSVRRR